MIPLVGEAKELRFVKGIVDKTAERIFAEEGVNRYTYRR